MPLLPYTESNYSSALTTASTLYSRPGNPWDGLAFFYESIQLQVGTTGFYTIFSNSSIDSEGYLYNSTFNLSLPDANLLAEDNDAGGNGQFMLNIMLSSMKNYTLVVSTYWARSTGKFSVVIYGPSAIGFSSSKKVSRMKNQIYFSSWSTDSSLANC